MSDISLDDLRVPTDEVTHIDGALIPGGPLHDVRPLTAAEFDSLGRAWAEENGWVKLGDGPACTRCGHVMVAVGPPIADAGSRKCLNCGSIDTLNGPQDAPTVARTETTTLRGTNIRTDTAVWVAVGSPFGSAPDD